MNLIRDVLDKLLVDPKDQPLGRADGLIVVVSENEQPRVTTIEVGSTVLAARLHPRLGRWARVVAGRFGLRRGRPTRIAWSKVVSTGVEVKVDLAADRTNALAWEHWLRDHFTRFIPGSR